MPQYQQNDASCRSVDVDGRWTGGRRRGSAVNPGGVSGSTSPSTPGLVSAHWTATSRVPFTLVDVVDRLITLFPFPLRPTSTLAAAAAAPSSTYDKNSYRKRFLGARAKQSYARRSAKASSLRRSAVSGFGFRSTVISGGADDKSLGHLSTSGSDAAVPFWTGSCSPLLPALVVGFSSAHPVELAYAHSSSFRFLGGRVSRCTSGVLRKPEVVFSLSC